ncbi:MAG: iron-containing alcohol dehydrogenase [Lachnospiraceae bacterium]|nr:iron-containing alcohol dehydrogenase [Lachnospiraceae bacterium]
MYRFFMPTEMLVGEISENSGRLKAIGKKALIVTGKSSKKNGALLDMENALKKEGIPYVIFDAIEENPSIENVFAAAELGRHENIDFLIGIGGGSPMDASKAISVLVKNPELKGEALIDGKSYPYYPVIAVPTTAGTGSEVTPYSIVTVHAKNTKMGISQQIFPVISFLNPKYMENMPLQVTLSTGVDAFTHLMEGYFSSKANFLSDKIAEGGFRGFKDCMEELKEGTISLETREKLLITSSIAGILISQTGTSLPHGMGYSLTYHKNVPHGFANNVFIEGYMKLCQRTMAKKVSDLLEILGFENIEEMAGYFNSLMDIDIKITKAEIEGYAEEFFENKAKLRNHPAEVSLEDIKNLYFESLKNYIAQ